MKPVIAWMKANLTIVILLAVSLLVLPTAFVGSQLWNKKIRTSRETAANKAMSDLKALSVTYVLPAAGPGGAAISLPRPVPNAAISEFFKTQRDALDAQVAQVGTVAKKINSSGHEPLVAGLFPEATDKLKIFQMVDLIVGKDGKPSVYQQLLNKINAGGAADAVRIAEMLNEEEAKFIDGVRAKNNRDKLLPEEEAELKKKLVALRIGQYQARASEISVYATADCLPAGIPKAAPAEAPDPTTCWDWQYDYWMVSDLIKAIDAANTDKGGKRLTLDKATVKRIEHLTLDSSTGPTPVSITGRKTSVENKLYDVRHATMSLIVASSKLPALVDAISSTNFMTVIGLDFSETDAWTDLERGFYYGPDHVVKATVDVETIWLRSWTEPLMPQAVKDTLTGAAATAEGSSAPAAVPAPATPRGRGNSEEGATSRGGGRPPATKSTKKPKGRGGGDG